MESGEGEHGRAGDAPAEEHSTDPTRELAAVPAAEDRCGACGAPLTHDQRYCVECGERRGQSRFPAAQPATEIRTTRTRTARPRRSTTVSSGTTLVAGVGVLLLAIGLGVLIGRLGQKSAPARAPAAQVITLQGGAGTGTAASTTPGTSTTVHVNKKTKAKKSSAASAPPSAAVQQKATQAAGKVLGNSKNLPPPTSTVGSKCSDTQSGCQGGKFTGNYFPGG
jgi:hypothetical protein